MFKELFISHVLFASGTDELQNLKYFFYVSVELGRLEPARTVCASDRTFTSPVLLGLYTIVAVQSIALGTLQWPGLNYKFAEATQEQFN